MKILIVGTGAVGGYYGAKLTAGGEDVSCLARGAMLKALQQQEIQIQSYQGNFSIKLEAIEHISDTAVPDLIIIAVKTYDTDAALEQFAPAVGPQTLLLSLQNGVESETKMVAQFGPDNVLGAVCYIGSEVTSPGTIVHSANGAVTIGELDGRESARVAKLHAIFERSGIEIYTSSDIKKTLWNKLLWNAPFNQVCAIERASVGEVLDRPELVDLLRGVMSEVVMLAQINGIDLNEESIEKHLDFSNKELRAVRPSMLQDLERGKRLEHEAFAGYIVREGIRLERPTPINLALYQRLCDLDPKA